MTTYSSIIADVQAYADRDDARLVAQLPSLITQAEERITLDIETAPQGVHVGAIVVASSSFSAGNDVVTKPSRWRQTLQFNYNSSVTGENRTPILRRSYAFCRRFWPDPSVTAAPRYYADYDQEHFLIVGTPSAAFDFELVYYERVEPLTVANQTNWLTDHAPGLLLYAVLLEAQPFLKRDERIQVWQAAYADALGKIILEQQRRESEFK